MYLTDLQKGYDMPIVAKAVNDYLLEGKSILDTLYECNNILDFCKTQNVGRQFHVEFTKGVNKEELQRYVRFYVSNNGGIIEKVNDNTKQRNNMCAGHKVTVINSLNDMKIEYRDINYGYYYKEALKIIDPIKLGISPNQKGDIRAGIKSGKSLIKKMSGNYNTLFDETDN